MPPPKSKCWIYFKKVDKYIAQCKICSQSIKFSGNTSNLAKHLKKHSNVLESGTNGSTKKTASQHLKLASTSLTNTVLTQSKQSSEKNLVLSKTVVHDTESETEKCVDDPTLFKSIASERPIIDAFNRISSYAEGDFNYKKITMYLLYFICKDYRSFAVVEGEGFDPSKPFHTGSFLRALFRGPWFQVKTHSSMYFIRALFNYVF